MTVNETLLSIIPGANDHQRLVIVSRQIASRSMIRLHQSESQSDADGVAEMLAVDRRILAPVSAPFCEQMQAVRERPIVLRQESFSPAVGWFTQSELELTTHQWAAMRSTIVPASQTPTKADNRKPAKRHLTGSTSWDCDVVAFPFDPDQAVPA